TIPNENVSRRSSDTQGTMSVGVIHVSRSASFSDSSLHEDPRLVGRRDKWGNRVMSMCVLWGPLRVGDDEGSGSLKTVRSKALRIGTILLRWWINSSRWSR
ncbi:unnamed protein product, partial [Sphacelaria rigidula]